MIWGHCDSIQIRPTVEQNGTIDKDEPIPFLKNQSLTNQVYPVWVNQSLLNWYFLPLVNIISLGTGCLRYSIGLKLATFSEFIKDICEVILKERKTSFVWTRGDPCTVVYVYWLCLVWMLAVIRGFVSIEISRFRISWTWRLVSIFHFGFNSTSLVDYLRQWIFMHAICRCGVMSERDNFVCWLRRFDLGHLTADSNACPCCTAWFKVPLPGFLRILEGRDISTSSYFLVSESLLEER